MNMTDAATVGSRAVAPGGGGDAGDRCGARRLCAVRSGWIDMVEKVWRVEDRSSGRRCGSRHHVLSKRSSGCAGSAGRAADRRRDRGLASHCQPGPAAAGRQAERVGAGRPVGAMSASSGDSSSRYQKLGRIGSVGTLTDDILAPSTVTRHRLGVRHVASTMLARRSSRSWPTSAGRAPPGGCVVIR